MTARFKKRIEDNAHSIDAVEEAQEQNEQEAQEYIRELYEIHNFPREHPEQYAQVYTWHKEEQERIKRFNESIKVQVVNQRKRIQEQEEEQKRRQEEEQERRQEEQKRRQEEELQRVSNRILQRAEGQFSRITEVIKSVNNLHSKQT